MFVKSTVKSPVSAVFEAPGSGGINGQLAVFVYSWFSYNTIFPSSVNQLSLSHFILVERQ